MEDSVGEEERREQGETMVKARQEDEQVEAVRGAGGEPGEDGGFLSAMASKIGAAMAGGNAISGEDGGTVNATAVSNGAEEKGGDEGHGGGGIFQKFMSSSHAPSPDSGASETEEVKGEERTQDTGGEQGGILSSMASRIGMAMSGANGNGHDHSAVDDANGDAVDNRKGENGDEASGGGILSSMASKIGMAMSSTNGHGDHTTVGDSKMSNGDAVDHANGEEKLNGGILSAMASKMGMTMSSTNGHGDHSTVGDAKMSNGDAVDHANGEEKANGGILSAMASKMGMSMSGANGEGNHGGSGDDAKTGNDHAAGESKVEEEGEANGGGLVDQIMSNLPSEDQAPEADEASLLIAIIED